VSKQPQRFYWITHWRSRMWR